MARVVIKSVTDGLTVSMEVETDSGYFRIIRSTRSHSKWFVTFDDGDGQEHQKTLIAFNIVHAFKRFCQWYSALIDGPTVA